MAQSESETVLTEHHETDNLDPRTDAPARPGTPVHIAPVQLGNITVPTPVVLSPMAGVTNWPFRVICEEYGPDGLYVAEMITARALVAHNPKALRLCHFAKSEKIRSLQLYGVNPSITEQAAKNRGRRQHGRPCGSELRLPGAQGHSSRRWFGLALENRHFH